MAILPSAAGRNPYDRDLTDLVGELSVRSDEFSDPDLTFVAHAAVPGSASADALRMLASWAATQDHEQAPDDVLSLPATD